jgi:hypothetical protein
MTTPFESQKDWEEWFKIHKNWKYFEFVLEFSTLSGKLVKNWEDEETKKDIEKIFQYCRHNEDIGYVDIQCNRCKREIYRDITGLYCDCKIPSIVIEKILSDYTFPEDETYFGIRKISDIPTIMYKNDSQLFVQGLDYRKYSVITFDDEDPDWKTVHRDWISIDKLLNELDSSHVIAESAYEALTSIDLAIFLCLDLLILKKWNHKVLQKTIEKIIDWKFMLMILWTTSNKYLSYEDEDNPIMINIDAHVIPKIKL